MIDHRKFLAMLEGEFSRYLGEHESLGERIPPNALIIFQVEGEPAFNAWHKQLSLTHREAAQPVVEIHVSQLRTHSLIESLDLLPSTT